MSARAVAALRSPRDRWCPSCSCALRPHGRVGTLTGRVPSCSCALTPMDGWCPSCSCAPTPRGTCGHTDSLGVSGRLPRIRQPSVLCVERAGRGGQGNHTGPSLALVWSPKGFVCPAPAGMVGHRPGRHGGSGVAAPPAWPGVSSQGPRPLRAATSKEGWSPSPVPAALTQFSSREPLCGGTQTRCLGPVTGSRVRSPSDPVVVVPCLCPLPFSPPGVGRGWPGVSRGCFWWPPPVTQEGGELPE